MCHFYTGKEKIMKIKTWRDPYDQGFATTRAREVEFKEGLTVLVGCNGSGKTTLIENIESECKKEKIPCLKYDNFQSGGAKSISETLFNGDTGLGATLMCSSEGEGIIANIGSRSSKFREFLKNGYVNDRHYRLSKMFKNINEKEEDKIVTNKRVFLFDACDSGMSIDNIIHIKKLFDIIIKDAKKSFNNEIYIIIACNSYELARDADCFNVMSGKYLRFKTYNGYRSFILKTAERKEKRELANNKKEGKE